MKLSISILLLIISTICYSQIRITNLKYNNQYIAVKDITYDVYIESGQSNMVGPGTSQSITQENLDRWMSVVNTTKTQMYLQDKPYIQRMDYRYYNISCCPSGYNLNDFSVEIPLATRFKTWHRPVIFVKYAVNGKLLYKDSLKTDFNPYSNELFTTLINTIDSFKLYMSNNNLRYEFKGVIWLQGESDANISYMANWYQMNQLKLIDSLRSYIGIDDLPFYLQEIYPSEPYSLVVNVAKNTVTALRQNVFITPYNTVEFKGDSVHMNANGIMTLGDSIYNQIVRLNY